MLHVKYDCCYHAAHAALIPVTEADRPTAAATTRTRTELILPNNINIQYLHHSMAHPRNPFTGTLKAGISTHVQRRSPPLCVKLGPK